MRSVILHCPALGRDISVLQAAVPGALVYESPLADPPGQVGGWEASKAAHQAIVAEAQALGESCVFVMEDDCVFSRYFSLERWCDAVDWAESHKYDVLVGGSTRTYREKVVARFDDDTALIEVSGFHSSHCVVYLKSGYDKVLRAGAPIDITIGHNEGARCLVTWPFVAVQRPSFSGCEGHVVNYVPLYEQHEYHLGAFVNGLIV